MISTFIYGWLSILVSPGAFPAEGTVTSSLIPVCFLFEADQHRAPFPVVHIFLRAR